MKRSEKLRQQIQEGRIARHPMNMLAKGIMAKDFSLDTDYGKAVVLKMPDNLSSPDDAWWLGIFHDLGLYNLEACDPGTHDNFTSDRINRLASPALLLMSDGENDWDMFYMRYNRASGKLSHPTWLTAHDEPDADKCMELFKRLAA